MELFNETTNKYLELLTYLINKEDTITHYKIERYLEKLSINKGSQTDWKFTETLFSGSDDGYCLFNTINKEYVPKVKKLIPVRLNSIENEALLHITERTDSSFFLSKDLITKIHDAYRDEETWDETCIQTKNKHISSEKHPESTYEKMSVIIRAIVENKAIRYDYKTRSVSLSGRVVCPIRIEFSLLNDEFRIYSYDFIKNIIVCPLAGSVSNISIVDYSPERERKRITRDELEKKLEDYLKTNMRDVVLQFDNPEKYTQERCFRQFSCYDRVADYDCTNNCYKLRISYHKNRESEVIKDILSLGSRAVVIEPESMKNEIVERVKKVIMNYGGTSQCF